MRTLTGLRICVSLGFLFLIGMYLSLISEGGDWQGFMVLSVVYILGMLIACISTLPYLGDHAAALDAIHQQNVTGTICDRLKGPNTPYR